MTYRFTLIWIAGLISIVPYSIYQLLFQAQRDEYAFLITLILFWIFGFWAVIGPPLSAYKIRQVYKQLESVESRQHMISLIKNEDTQHAAIDLIARENRIPRFIANKLYHYIQHEFPQNSSVDEL